MRSTTMLAVAALCVAACKGPDYGLGTGSCFMDSCPAGPGNYGPFTVTTSIGFPSSRVDTTGALTPSGHYYGRLQVGDSVALYVVQHTTATDPCTAPDTLRTVTWSTHDPAVLQTRTDPNGRGVVRALASGESMVVATSPTLGATASFWTCSATNRSDHYVESIRVVPKTP